jgi:DNA-binding MarR family transcriptional regulator
MSSGISIISNSLFQYGEQSVDRLQTMTVFVAVAEETGFAAAAGRLNMSPPSVTRAVSELETRLGARLLHRTTRSVRLTEAGHRYLADCRRILSEIDEAEQHAAGVHATPRGMVSVSASALCGRMVVAPILLGLLDRYPEISDRHHRQLGSRSSSHLVLVGIKKSTGVAKRSSSRGPLRLAWKLSEYPSTAGWNENAAPSSAGRRCLLTSRRTERP